MIFLIYSTCSVMWISKFNLSFLIECFRNYSSLSQVSSKRELSVLIFLKNCSLLTWYAPCIPSIFLYKKNISVVWKPLRSGFTIISFNVYSNGNDYIRRFLTRTNLAIINQTASTVSVERCYRCNNFFLEKWISHLQ